MVLKRLGDQQLLQLIQASTIPHLAIKHCGATRQVSATVPMEILRLIPTPQEASMLPTDLLRFIPTPQEASMLPAEMVRLIPTP